MEWLKWIQDKLAPRTGRIIKEDGVGILDTDQKEKVLIVFNWVEEAISNARL